MAEEGGVSQRYFEEFPNALEIAREFNIDFTEFTNRDEFPRDEDILFAIYEQPSYDGDAFVLFRRMVWNKETGKREEKLFEVHGGHCSCNGLEGQWVPEETTWAALALRQTEHQFGCQNHDELRALIGRHVAHGALTNDAA